MPIIPGIYSYRELLRRGCEKPITPPQLKNVPLGSKKVEGAILHPASGLVDPVGYFDSQSRLFYNREGICLGRVAKSGNSRRFLPNLVTLVEHTYKSGKVMDFLVDENKKRIAFFVPAKDRTFLVVDRKNNQVIGTMLIVPHPDPHEP